MDIDSIKTVGVVGCGLMGAGIVETCARAGFHVVVREVNDDLLQKGLKRLQDSMSKAAQRGKLSQADLDATLSRIKGTLNLSDFKDCDLVIEAAVENMSLKKTLFTELDSICRSDVILASNTSSLCVTEMASATERPDKVLGLHFFNPVPVMPLLEIVRALLTSDEALWPTTRSPVGPRARPAMPPGLSNTLFRLWTRRATSPSRSTTAIRSRALSLA